MRRLEVLGWLLVMAGGLVLDLAVFGPREVAGWLPDVAVGWAFLGGGLVLRTRLRAGRIAFVLGLTGSAW
ncbi:MAG TPA: hypothetical protein VFG13_09730, partial [Blastococcus sp.]|nr:hypothetical protein [Blastococcus sp.]